MVREGDGSRARRKGHLSGNDERLESGRALDSLLRRIVNALVQRHDDVVYTQLTGGVAELAVAKIAPKDVARHERLYTVLHPLQKRQVVDARPKR